MAYQWNLWRNGFLISQLLGSWILLLSWVKQQGLLTTKSWMCLIKRLTTSGKTLSFEHQLIAMPTDSLFGSKCSLKNQMVKKYKSRHRHGVNQRDGHIWLFIIKRWSGWRPEGKSEFNFQAKKITYKGVWWWNWKWRMKSKRFTGFLEFIDILFTIFTYDK